MNYENIKETIEKFHYELPVVSTNDEGLQMTVDEGYEDIAIRGKDIKLHYYIVYTYLASGNVRICRYYSNGMISEEDRISQ